MKNRLPLSVSPDRFYRALDQAVLPHGPLSPFRLSETPVFCGRRRGDRFFLYRRGAHRFALLPCVLSGRIVKEKNDRFLVYRFRRPLFSTLLLGLWCALLLITGRELLFSEPLFALSFLIPALRCALPLFFFSSAARSALLEKLCSLTK